jgi:2-oxo-4-hydroxy-4-carboxy-5-ureidoimidazoline decarboxylase
MLNIANVNALERHDFTNTFAAMFEHSPWIAARTAPKRPFRDRAEFFAALCDTVMKASHDEKLCLIRAHPDLVSRDILTAESRGEQAGAGLGQLSTAEKERFHSYNEQYREKFGFPFIICARLNKKDAILEAFPVRLQNSPEKELQAALCEIFKIAQFRLQDLVE